jgi:hypothetical protein
MNIKKLFTITLLLLTVLPSSGFSQEKLAQTGMKFLLVSLDARVAAMGDAVTALEGNSSSIFFNPSAMARLNKAVDVTVTQLKWIADISYYGGAVAFAPYNGDYGVAGISFMYVDYGDFYATIRAPQNDLGYIDLGTFRPNAYSFGISYAKALSDKFSVGGNIRYASQNLDASVTATDPTNASYTKKSYVPSSIVYDFGMLYHTGIKSLDFGVSVRNFAKEIKLEQEGYQLPLIFQLGFAFNLSDVLDLDKNEHSLQIALDANHPRDFSEQIMLGIDYTFMKIVSLRVGMATPNDEHEFTFGLGLRQTFDNLDFGIDYAYIPWTTFSDVHKFSLHFSL